MNARKLFIALGCVIGPVATLPPTAKATDVPDVRSAVFISVDISQTWHRKDNDSRNQSLLKTVNQGVVALAGRIERPIFVAYTGIGDQAVAQTLICKAHYQPTLLTGNRDTVLKKPRDLASFLGACAKGAIARPSAPWTDISGALNFVSRQLGETAKPTDRYAIVLSDMKEERGNRGAVTPNLKGFKVLLVYRALPEDDTNPKGLEERLQIWRKRLTEAGARVSMVIDTGLVAQSIANLADEQR